MPTSMNFKSLGEVLFKLNVLVFHDKAIGENITIRTKGVIYKTISSFFPFGINFIFISSF